jgi:hypothetical protein
MPLGYDIKEEAIEVKKNLFASRDSLIVLVVGTVLGGVITKFMLPEFRSSGSIFDRLKSWFGYDEKEE